MIINKTHKKNFPTLTQKLGINELTFYKTLTILLAFILTFSLFLFSFILYHLSLEQERAANSIIEYADRIDNLSEQISVLKKNISNSAESETSTLSNISNKIDTDFYVTIGVGLAIVLFACLAYYFSTQSGLDIPDSPANIPIISAADDNSNIPIVVDEKRSNEEILRSLGAWLADLPE